MIWFAKVDGRIYGPYSDEIMQGFVAEGRINGQSQITNNPSAGFYDAQAFDIYAFWAGTGQARVNAAPLQLPGQMAPVAQSQVKPTAAFTEEPHIEHPVQSARVVAIIAEIRSSDGRVFYQALSGFGPVERVSDTLWLVKTAQDVQALRNSLSQTLGRADRMFIMDGASNGVAWFNIGADLDKRIRDFWDDE